MSLIHRTGDLWDIQMPHQIICHSVNALGTWGAGFAKQLRNITPEAYRDYKYWCELGEAETCNYRYYEPNKILSICTSFDIGINKGSVESVLYSTSCALTRFLNDYYPKDKCYIISPEINAGLFGVPWKETEEVILNVLKEFPRVEWTVCHQAGVPKCHQTKSPECHKMN